jgi:hypothetical protein
MPLEIDSKDTVTDVCAICGESLPISESVGETEIVVNGELERVYLVFCRGCHTLWAVHNFDNTQPKNHYIERRHHEHSRERLDNQGWS